MQRQSSRRSRSKEIKKAFKPHYFVGCDSDGMSRGVTLFWHDSIVVEVKEVTTRFIDVHVREDATAPVWHATFCVW
jgi:hypothetical protein